MSQKGELDRGHDLGRKGLGTKLDQLITLANRLRNQTLTAPGLQTGSGDAAKVEAANAITYLIGGAFKTLAGAEHAFTATTHDIAANAASVQERVYVLSVDAAGTVTITAGTIATGSGNAEAPAAPAGEAVMGTVRIAVAAGATPFDATTDLLSAGHLTVTYTDLGYLDKAVDALV